MSIKNTPRLEDASDRRLLWGELSSLPNSAGSKACATCGVPLTSHRLAGGPTFEHERAMLDRLGPEIAIAGVDEAGRGPLAGPVVAAAVIWGDPSQVPDGLNDSKQVSPARREKLFGEVMAGAPGVGVGVASPGEIDAVNILQATRLAARRALDALGPAVGAALTDALELPGWGKPVEAIVKGDARSISIAAASIIAKVTRDRLMDHYARQYPGYGWEHNRGYPTHDHYQAIENLGPTTLHRITFAGVGFFVEQMQPSAAFRTLWESARRGTLPEEFTKSEYAVSLCFVGAHSAEGREVLASLDRCVSSAAPSFVDLCRFLDPRERQALCDAARTRGRAVPEWLAG